jgi:hypothetical protein
MAARDRWTAEVYVTERRSVWGFVWEWGFQGRWDTQPGRRRGAQKRYCAGEIKMEDSQEGEYLRL